MISTHNLHENELGQKLPQKKIKQKQKQEKQEKEKNFKKTNRKHKSEKYIFFMIFKWECAETDELTFVSIFGFYVVSNSFLF